MINPRLLRPAKIERPLRDAAKFLVPRSEIPDLGITGITLDSRRVCAGDLYVALPGAFHHGASFAAEAHTNGAVAVLTDQVGSELIGAKSLPVIIVADPRSVLGHLSAWTYGYPASDLLIVGITGTDGKTTTAMLLEAALRGSGHRTGLIGTIATRVADFEFASARTTPEAPDLQALLAVMREHEVTAVVMEVSSHALAFGRVDDIEFDLAVFTNLGHDHLDFHHDQESYFQAKADLFTSARSKRGLVSIDDAWGRRLMKEAQIPVQSYSVAFDSGEIAKQADWLGGGLVAEGVGFRFELQGPDGVDVVGASGLAGVFNVRNSIAAAAAAITLGGDPQLVVDAIEAGSAVPGRMEPIDLGQPFVVLVDYAHTPDAVERALDVGHDLAARRGGRLLVVLGCGGDRDREKRPLMGAIAARLADVVVVTDDNPRSEDPAKIRGEILAGIKPTAAARVGATAQLGAEVIERAGREHALHELVQMARSGDVLMALGKGHESGQEVAGTVYPLDDRTILRSAITVAIS